VIIMNNRKQQVVKNAHHLFVEKGFQATSIQDIIDYSGISKGTFYNYFSSKNELLIAVFTWLHTTIEQERNQLLVGKSLTDVDVFVKQIDAQMKNHHKHKFFTLLEEVFVSNDPDLKAYIKNTQFIEVNWVYKRFIDLFGQEKKPYLLDCAIMFLGMLHRNFHYNFMVNGTNTDPHEIISYSVKRLLPLVEEVANSGDILLDPQTIKEWLPSCPNTKNQIEQDISAALIDFKKQVHKQFTDEFERQKCTELISFIEEELFKQPNPRKFVVDSALHSLKQLSVNNSKTTLEELQTMIDQYVSERH